MKPDGFSVLQSELGGRSIIPMIEADEFSAAETPAKKSRDRETSTWTQMQQQKPSGRQDHWTDRIAAEDDNNLGVDSGFAPNKIIKRIKLRTR